MTNQQKKAKRFDEALKKFAIVRAEIAHQVETGRLTEKQAATALSRWAKELDL